LYALTAVEPTCTCVAHLFGNAADHPECVRRYPSDVTDAEWAGVRPLLPVPGWLRGRSGQPEAYCHRAILDAIRYLVDDGIKWRAMPADFPQWDRVYAFFRRWPGGGKLINGRKRHVVVDTLGLLLGVMVTAADTGDRTAAQVLLEQVAGAHHWLALVWAEGGYTGSLVDSCLAALALGLAIVKRSDGQKGFVVLPKRWIVECLFAHLMRTRRLARDFERRTNSAEAMIYWSMILLMARRLARPRRSQCEPARRGFGSQPRRPAVSPSNSAPPPWSAPRPAFT
jgi:transposase